MKKFNFFFLCLLSFSTVACSYIKGAPTSLRKSDTEFLQAQDIQRLKTPKGYSALDYEDKYPIPSQKYSKGSERIKLTPPDVE